VLPPITFSVAIGSLTAPNTSACNSTSLASYCGFAYTGWSDARFVYAADESLQRCSDGDFQGTRHGGRRSQPDELECSDLAHTQFWFTNNGSSTSTRDGVSYPYDGSHLKNGVTSNNQAYITAMVQDLWDRGFDGLLGNWKGGANTCTYPTFNSACGTTNSARRSLRESDRHDAGESLDDEVRVRLRLIGVLASECAGDANEPKCVQLKIDADLDYADTAYFAKRELHQGFDSKPIVLFFIDESNYFSQCTGGAPCNLSSGTCTSQSACWTSVWSGVNSHTTGQGVPISMVFENSAASRIRKVRERSHGSSRRTSAAQASQRPRKRTGRAGTYLDNWYNNANTTYASKLAFGLALKGFDSETASWYYPNGRVIAQQCGQVWLNSFARTTVIPTSTTFRFRRGMTTKKVPSLRQASITASRLPRSPSPLDADDHAA
jgi:hypothetical protein